MKKSLVIISFAFIFLLTMSVVSAGFWDWLTGKGTTVEIKGGCDATGGPACPKKTIVAAYECPPLPQGICDGEADPKSITIEDLREMVKEAGGEYECPPLPQGICDGEADPKSPAFRKSDKIVTKKRTSAGVSSSGTRCGTPNTPVCDNAGIIKRTDGRQVRPMLGINNNKRPVARLPPTENDLPTGGEKSLKGLNLTNATIGLAREKFKINFTNQTGCTNECAFAGQNVVCWLPGNLPGNQTCGNFDDDLCLEWSSCV